MDISFIEFLVYALIGYSSIIVLVVSVITTPPMTKSLSLIRVAWMFPSIIALIVLAGSGVNINMETVTTTSVTNQTNINHSTGLITERLDTNSTVTETNQFVLQNPVWIIFHYMLAAVLMVYMLLQFLTLLTKIE